MQAIVGTRSGKIEGRVREGVHQFLGIPYASPPLRELRWQPPVQEEPWEGVRDATRFGPQSAQGTFRLGELLGGPQLPISEDSLTLNVFTPKIDESRRPVMVWIHGGGFTNGTASTSLYDGSRLCTNGDVVVVTLNYRLASFGFLHLADMFGSEFEGSGNLGLLDQISALEWVRENIVAFGGDPHNVTIFGQSAGAGSIGILLGLPRARGLFSGAILQSGAASWYHSRAAATSNTEKIIEALGVRHGDVEALRSKTTQEILGAQKVLNLDTEVVGLAFTPVLDGTVVARPPLEEISSGNTAGISLILGTNADEMTIFNLVDPELGQLDLDEVRRRVNVWTENHDLARILVNAYQNQHPGTTTQELWTTIAGDAAFHIPAIRLAEAHLPHGPVWNYVFSWPTPIFGGSLRSTHGLEIPFVWNALDQPSGEIMTGTDPQRLEVGSVMSQAWIAFCHQGAPQHPAIPEWPCYDLDNRAALRFDTTCELLVDPHASARHLWNSATGDSHSGPPATWA